MSRLVSRAVGGWRTGLSRPVLILQAGNGVNYFGYGLVLPFEIIYLHQARGFATSTAGFVLAATMAMAAIATPLTGALLDRYSAKALVAAGCLASALGYAGFACVQHPWQGFACSVVGGAGLGVAGTANRTLVVRLIRPEQRAAAFALGRAAGNFGIGAGATLAGFVVAAAQRLTTFQGLYLFDAITSAGFALIVLAAVPSPRAEIATATPVRRTGPADRAIRGAGDRQRAANQDEAEGDQLRPTGLAVALGNGFFVRLRSVERPFYLWTTFTSAPEPIGTGSLTTALSGLVPRTIARRRRTTYPGGIPAETSGMQSATSPSRGASPSVDM